MAGTSLQRYISAGRRASPAAAARTVEQLARAIAVCHYDGVVHGAPTPKAVLIDSRNGDALIDDLERPLSTAVGDHRVGDDHVVRDLDYTAPWDRKTRQATPSGDIYALGCILHALLVGKPPAQNGAQDGRVSQRVARSLRAIVARAISESPAERYPTASAMARDLEHAATTLSGSSRLEVPNAGASDDGTRRRHRFSRRARRICRIAGFALLAGAILLGIAQERGSHQAATAVEPAAVSRPDSTSNGTKRGSTNTGTGTRDGTGGTQKRSTSTHHPNKHPTSGLIEHLPREWEPRSRPGPRDRTAALTVDVPGIGWVQITYRAGSRVAPLVQMREQRRRDELAARVRPLELRPLRIAGVPMAVYARRVEGAIQVSHRFTADTGEFMVVAHAAGRRAAERLARTASRAIVRPRRTLRTPSPPSPVGPRPSRAAAT